MTVDQSIAAYVLGRVLRSDLPQIATQMLEEGYDAPDLAVLAGTTPQERPLAEFEELWHRGLRHLGKPLPSEAGAGRILRNYYASLVSSGSMPPRNGAAEIIRLAGQLSDVLPDREYAGDGLGVAKLLGLYYSHDDVPYGDDKSHREIDEELRAECKRIANENTGLTQT
jgi:hypothetical protein